MLYLIMAVAIDGFQWDSGNIEKIKKHGLTQDDVEFIFLNEPWVGPDFKHSTEKENRYIAYGRIEIGRPAYIAFTYRLKEGLNLIRPISARFMHEKEVKKYEKT